MRGGHWTPFNILGVLMTTLTPLKLRRNEFGMDCSCFMGKSLGLSRQNFSSCLGHSLLLLDVQIVMGILYALAMMQGLSQRVGSALMCLGAVLKPRGVAP